MGDANNTFSYEIPGGGVVTVGGPIDGVTVGMFLLFTWVAGLWSAKLYLFFFISLLRLRKV